MAQQLRSCSSSLSHLPSQYLFAAVRSVPASYCWPNALMLGIQCKRCSDLHDFIRCVHQAKWDLPVWRVELAGASFFSPPACYSCDITTGQGHAHTPQLSWALWRLAASLFARQRSELSSLYGIHLRYKLVYMQAYADWLRCLGSIVISPCSANSSSVSSVTASGWPSCMA